MQTVSREQLLKVSSDVLSIAARKGLSAGSRLPAERELATRLGLSRTTVRNAMALLEDEKIVSREVGRGTFLRDDPRNAMSSDFEIALHHSIAIAVSPTDVMAARKLIEPASMSSIVENATMNDFDEIERCLRGSESAVSYEDVEMWDLALHHALIRASHNPLMENMYLLIDEARRGSTWGNLKRRSDSEDRRNHYRQQHRAIAEALRDRDGRKAREAMQVHLDTVEANLQASAQS